MSMTIGDELGKLNQDVKRSLDQLHARYQDLLRDMDVSQAAMARALPPVVEGVQRVLTATAVLEARTRAYEEQLKQTLRS